MKESCFKKSIIDDAMQYPDWSDERLVNYVRKQDKEAYREIIRRYQEKLMRYAQRLVGDEHVASDVVQNSFIKAYKNLNGFDTKRKFSSWIYRIVHNEALSELKSRRRFISLDGSTWLKSKLAASQDIEQEYAKQEVKKMIEESLNKIDIKYKEPLILFYLEDMRYEQISEILHLPAGTVATRISRGKVKLKKVYEEKR